LGGSVLPVLRHIGLDHAKTGRWIAARNLRLGAVPGAVLHPRQRYFGTQVILKLLCGRLPVWPCLCGAGALARE